MKFFSFILASVFFLQANAWGISTIIDDDHATTYVSQFDKSINDEVSAEMRLLDTMEPSKAEARFLNKFDRKFKKFRNDVNLFIQDLTDSELLEMLHDLIHDLKTHGNFEYANAIMKNYTVISEKDVRNILIQMVSVESQINAKQELKNKIELAGGFSAYQKQVKKYKKEHINVACRAGKIAAIVFITPIVLLSMQSGLAVGAAVYFWSLSALELTLLIGTFLGLHIYVLPRMIYRLKTGCYKVEA
jgi:hypothetical protein